jgi:chemotaxis protein MotA
VDVATILGVVAGFGLIIGSIVMNGELRAFIDPPSLLIVVGGTIASTLIAERLPRVLGGIKVGLNTIFSKTPDPVATIEKITELATAARKDGILALEKAEIDQKFLAKGVRLAVDGIAPEEIKSSLQGEFISLKQRHKRGQKLFRFMSGTAPSMGMIGTLIGLVQMLQSLDDPAAIGPAMAVALLTTLYGAILAFLLCAPLADKLETRTSEETANMIIVMEGIDGILKGENPKLIKEKLEGYLAPKLRAADKKE